MRFRPLLALMLAFCLTFTTLPSSASAALKGREQGNARFGNVVNTGQADACTVLPAGSSGSLNADGQFKSLCLQPTEVSVKLPGNKRNKSDLQLQKLSVLASIQVLMKYMEIFPEGNSLKKVVLISLLLQF